MATSASSLESASVPTVLPSHVYQVACNKLKETVKDAAEYGFSGVEESLNDEQLHTLANRFVQFIEKIDVKCGVPTAARVAEFFEDACWCPVGEKWILMLPNSMIGKGTESEVYRGLVREGQECAVKFWGEKPEEWLEKQNEFYKLMSFSPHIIKRIATNEYYGIEPLCRGNVYDVLEDDPSFVDDHKQQINEGLLQGLADIHAKGYVYSDLKLLNILLTEAGDVMFGDFGDCYSKDSFPSKGTYSEWAPERIDYHLEIHKLGKEEHALPYAQKGDIWQAMIVLADLNKTLLSEPFYERFCEYTSKQNALAQELAQSGRGLVKLGLEPSVLELERSKLVLKCAEGFSAYFDQKRMTGDGLFSDLVPTTHFEKLLIRMSMFDPADRISAAEALAHLKAYGVAATIEVFPRQ